MNENQKAINPLPVEQFVIRFMCLLCGRNKFMKPGPHKCMGGQYIKNFRKIARKREMKTTWIEINVVV